MWVVSLITWMTLKRISTKKPGNVRFDIYSIKGEKVTSVVKKSRSPGEYEFKLDLGDKYSSGAYILRMNQKGESPLTKKILFLK